MMRINIDKTGIEQLIQNYGYIIQSLLDDSERNLSDINFLSSNEEFELVQKLNNTEVEYQKKTVLDLFEEQVEITPNQIAIEFEDVNLTYDELNKKSNSLAHLLTENLKGKRNPIQSSEDVVIGVMLERSLNSVVSMVGVMKTGAIYVPIDHEYPTSRVRFIIEDSKLDLIISTVEFAAKHGIDKEKLVELHKVESEKGYGINLKHKIDLDDSAFVIYTSGSTGKPKGVLQTHKMLSNLIQWDINNSGIKPGLKYLQYSSFSFDATLHDIYFTLSAGGTAYIATNASRLNYSSLMEEVVANQIEVLSMPFSALTALCHEVDINSVEGHVIKYIISTGEQLYVNSSLKAFLEKHPHIELHNHYGPSETHVVTGHSMNAQKGNIESRSSIGKPISNTIVYILDENRKLVPKGAIGELYFGGSNLAKGYLNQPELTAEKFLTNPFQDSEKLYKTGDFGKWLANGDLEFLGRIDDQVKIRGFRIELGEVEHAILSDALIDQAAVIAKGEGGHQELIAYVTSSEKLNATELRANLKIDLPEYMMPSYFVQLDSIPLTRNGKVDRIALPDPKGLGIVSGVNYVPPKNNLQKRLVEIWKDLLQIEKIGIKDDFFTLGGHSLKAIRLVNRYQKAFNVEVGIKELFLHSTIESQSNLIESAHKKDFVKIHKVPKQEVIRYQMHKEDYGF